jgi:hypothetical protein
MIDSSRRSCGYVVNANEVPSCPNQSEFLPTTRRVVRTDVTQAHPTVRAAAITSWAPSPLRSQPSGPSSDVMEYITNNTREQVRSVAIARLAIVLLRRLFLPRNQDIFTDRVPHNPSASMLLRCLCTQKQRMQEADPIYRSYSMRPVTRPALLPRCDRVQRRSTAYHYVTSARMLFVGTRLG